MHRLYKWLYTRVGGRPWTYILRDWWDDYEFVWIVGLVALGVWLGNVYTWQAVLKGWLIFSAGYVCGHLFWGAKHIEGEQ